jgi:nucleoside-diphosphate-sugar epimerase
MQTILGANGIIGTELAKELYTRFTKDIKLVSRHPHKVNSSDVLFAADLLNGIQTEQAVKGSDIVYLTVGLPVDWKTAGAQWPVIMQNVIDACLKQNAKLVFFDNTYMYGTANGIITEETPFLSTGNKGKVRGQISTMLNEAIQNTDLIAMICRAPEFYGPRNTKSIANTLFFETLKKSKKIKVLLRDDTLRTLIYAPDAAKAMALLGNTPDAYHQTWHLPCDTDLLTSKEFIKFMSEIYGKKLRYFVLKKWMIHIISLFNTGMRETIELLYRYKTDYIFDSSRFKRRFPDYKITTYQEGITEIIREIKQIKIESK